MNANENAIIRTVPAAGDLHKVTGFDPLQHLQRAVSGSGEPVFQLGLRCKRLWFRLACPNGRLLLNPLRITDQMAIFEAQVFFQREDPSPASSFTSTKTAQEDKGYIRAAQEEALSIALDNTGFGIQLCDVTQGTDGGKPLPEVVRPQAGTADEAQPVRGSPTVPAPVTDAKQQISQGRVLADPAVSAQPVQSTAQTSEPTRTVQQSAEAMAAVSDQPQRTVETDATVQQNKVTPADKAVPVQAEAPTQAATSAQQQAAVEPADTAQTESRPVEVSAAHQEPEVLPTQERSSVKVLNFPTQQAEPKNGSAPVEGIAPAASAEPEAAASPAYTEDMSVEDISARMTVDEARKVVVAEGTCKGWTLEQVAEKRPSSLKFFVTPFCQATNAFKAAATLMLQEVNQQKAS